MNLHVQLRVWILSTVVLLLGAGLFALELRSGYGESSYLPEGTWAPPRVESEREGGGPSWLAAYAAVDAEGELEWSELGSFRRDVELLLETAAIPLDRLDGEPTTSLTIRDTHPSTGEPIVWVYFGTGSDDDVFRRNRATLASALEISEAVYAGEVIGTTPGIWDAATVASLVTVRIEEVLHAGEGYPRTGVVHLLYPEARFRVGSTYLWRGSPYYPPLPAVGASILFGTTRSPAGPESRILFPQSDLLFYEGAYGTAQRVQLREDVGRGREFEHVLDEVKQSLSGSNR